MKSVVGIVLWLADTHLKGTQQDFLVYLCNNFFIQLKLATRKREPNNNNNINNNNTPDNNNSNPDNNNPENETEDAILEVVSSELISIKYNIYIRIHPLDI